MRLVNAFGIACVALLGCATNPKTARLLLTPNFEISNYTRLFLSELNSEMERNAKTGKSFIPSAQLMHTYHLQQLKSGYSIFGFIKVNNGFSASKLRETGTVIGSQSGNIITVQVPLNSLPAFLRQSGIIYFEISHKTSLNK